MHIFSPFVLQVSYSFPLICKIHEIWGQGNNLALGTGKHQVKLFTITSYNLLSHLLVQPRCFTGPLRIPALIIPVFHHSGARKKHRLKTQDSVDQEKGGEGDQVTGDPKPMVSIFPGGCQPSPHPPLLTKLQGRHLSG